MICAPDTAKLLYEFESSSCIEEPGNTSSSYHKEGLVSQKTFEMQTMPEFGNPYFDDCPELLILNSHDCADD